MLFAQLIRPRGPYRVRKPRRADQIGQQDRLKLIRLRHHNPLADVARKYHLQEGRNAPGSRFPYRLDGVAGRSCAVAPAVRYGRGAARASRLAGDQAVAALRAAR